MRILLMSRYARLGASSRLRSYQYLPYLEETGFDVIQAPLFGDDYVRGLYTGKISKLAVLRAYFERIRFMLKARKFDLVWVEKEMLPWLPSWIELGLFSATVPLVVDYDDALFHKYDQHRFSIIRRVLGKKIDAVMHRADLVMVGNEYLGSRAREAGARRVELLPTVVDAERYGCVENLGHSTVTIGWIGQPSTAGYLLSIVPALQKIMNSHSVRVVAVGPNPLQLSGLPVEVRSWSEASEVAEIQQFDIGIMPLSDSLWEKGKCGYKLVQYMACGKPVVASPVGVNKEIVQHGLNGYLADSEREWNNALDELCTDALLRKRMGSAGRAIVEKNYSLKVTAPKLAAIFRSVAKNNIVRVRQ
jgi:glycosyltransferase involved in cell wall biosynthesis